MRKPKPASVSRVYAGVRSAACRFNGDTVAAVKIAVKIVKFMTIYPFSGRQKAADFFFKLHISKPHEPACITAGAGQDAGHRKDFPFIFQRRVKVHKSSAFSRHGKRLCRRFSNAVGGLFIPSEFLGIDLGIAAAKEQSAASFSRTGTSPRASL